MLQPHLSTVAEFRGCGRVADEYSVESYCAILRGGTTEIRILRLICALRASQSVYDLLLALLLHDQGRKLSTLAGATSISLASCLPSEFLQPTSQVAVD
jgi:hypothetical protein